MSAMSDAPVPAELLAPELLSCPFCGGKTRRLGLTYSCMEEDGGCTAIVGWPRMSEAEAVAAWNRRSPVVEGASVMALEWRDDFGGNGLTVAKDGFGGLYWIYATNVYLSPPWHLHRRLETTHSSLDDTGATGTKFGTKDEAKAAAQADYSQRIMSALAHPAPAPATEPTAWLYEVKDVPWSNRWRWQASLWKPSTPLGSEAYRSIEPLYRHPAPALPVEAGWKLVPIEPTMAMFDAALDAGWSDACSLQVYRAMLSASPTNTGRKASSFEYGEYTPITVSASTVAPPAEAALVEPPISPLMRDDGRPAWQQVEDLLRKTPYWLLRDEVVCMWEWARCATTVASALSRVSAERDDWKDRYESLLADAQRMEASIGDRHE